MQSKKKQDKGLFLVIEGTDGSGKGTQFRLLVDRLQKEGYEVETYDFPQYDQESSYFVRQYLNGKYGTAEEVGPYTGSLFYALDRYESAPKIKQALEAGKVVIANRYTGSNMAHQGTKFENVEERKGYYLWLDAIEFQMLRIPRPDLSLVLRVPAEIAQQLIDQKKPRTYTDRKRDLHEADIDHLNKAVEVYDNLCQLFPKDFKELDCVRGNKLLDEATINNLIWETIAPILPPKGLVKTLENKKLLITTPTANSQVQATVQQDVSSLLLQKLDWGKTAKYCVFNGEPRQLYQAGNKNKANYYIPKNFDTKTKKSFIESIDKIYDLYSKISHSLIEYLQLHSEVPESKRGEVWRYDISLRACDTTRAVLPLASLETVSIFGTDNTIQNLITDLKSDILPEGLETSLKLPKQKKQESESKEDIVKFRTRTNQIIKKLAVTQLSEKYSPKVSAVKLISAWPSNELDLVPDILYSYSVLSLEQIEHEVGTWTYDQKAEIFNACLDQRLNSQHIPNQAFEKLHYSWDLICDSTTLQQLQRNSTVEDMEWQQLTPRYGYEVPDIIEAAGLTDYYEACFDISLQLYSTLQSAGYEHEAQYAILYGHKLRCKVTFNGREAFPILESGRSNSKSSNYNVMVKKMHEKITETHPLTASAIKYID